MEPGLGREQATSASIIAAVILAERATRRRPPSGWFGACDQIEPGGGGRDLGPMNLPLHDTSARAGARGRGADERRLAGRLLEVPWMAPPGAAGRGRPGRRDPACRPRPARRPRPPTESTDQRIYAIRPEDLRGRGECGSPYEVTCLVLALVSHAVASQAAGKVWSWMVMAVVMNRWP